MFLQRAIHRGTLLVIFCVQFAAAKGVVRTSKTSSQNWVSLHFEYWRLNNKNKEKSKKQLKSKLLFVELDVLVLFS